MPPDRVDFEALGSRCSLVARDAGDDRLQRGVAWVHTMHARLTRFDPASELCRLNAAAGRWTQVSDELEHLLRESLRAWELSGGLVNVAVLPALLELGYTQSLSLGAPAARAGGALAVPVPALPDVLEVGPGRARLAPGAAVDLGGIAKGWLADRLADRLGVSCVANLGGDLAARGEGPDGEGWPVGFGDTTLMLRDQGAATSSTRLRAWTRDGRSVHHLVDPRTGRESRTDLGDVSVVAADATRAEVCAKTALLLGAAGAPVFLAQHCAAWQVA